MCSTRLRAVLQTNHLVFSSLFDPSNVVAVLLPDAVSHVGADLLQDAGGDVVCSRKVLGVAGRAHPAKRPEAQRENITGRETEQRSITNQVSPPTD